MSHDNNYTKFTRADIEAIEDIREEWIPIDIWKAMVLLRGVPMETVDALEKKATKGKGKKKEIDADLFGYYLISKCLLDPETREPMYSISDVIALKKKSAGAIVQLATAVRDINGLGDESKKDHAVEL